MDFTVGGAILDELKEEGQVAEVAQIFYNDLSLFKNLHYVA